MKTIKVKETKEVLKTLELKDGVKIKAKVIEEAELDKNVFINYEVKSLTDKINGEIKLLKTEIIENKYNKDLNNDINEAIAKFIKGNNSYVDMLKEDIKYQKEQIKLKEEKIKLVKIENENALNKKFKETFKIPYNLYTYFKEE